VYTKHGKGVEAAERKKIDWIHKPGAMTTAQVGGDTTEQKIVHGRQL